MSYAVEPNQGAECRMHKDYHTKDHTDDPRGEKDGMPRDYHFLFQKKE